MALAIALEDAILAAILTNAPLSVATPYVSLHTADPGQTGVSEVVVSRELGVFGAPSGGIARNSAPVVFTLMPACTVTHFGIWDAASSGNFLWGGILDVPQIVNSGGTFEFLTAQLALAVN